MVQDTDIRSGCVPTYRLLTAQQIQRFHQATLELLETVGVKVRHGPARAMLRDAGCRVTSDDVVFIPAGRVQECIDSAPSGITIYNRNGHVAMQLEGTRSYFGLGTDLARTYDLETGELRPSQLGDVAIAAQIADALKEIDFIGSYALAYDVPANLMGIEAVKTQLENSTKPIFFTAAGEADLAVIYEMAAVVAGGEDCLAKKPLLIHYSEPMSPLTHSTGAVEKLFYCADRRLPITYTPGMMSGASAPVTTAGAVIQGNAEALSGVVLHQLRNPGAPIISGFGMSTLDMQTSACIYGCPEYRLAISACADLYHHYQLPVWGTAGASDANSLDQQATMEWAISLLIDVLNGANLIHDVGYLGQGLIGHPAAIVMCAEIISYVRRFARGFEDTAVHQALEVIRRVGHQGSYLETDHTHEFFRRSHWRPLTGNRRTLEQWLQNNAPDWGEAAAAKAREILANHRPEKLPTPVRQSLDAIRARAAVALKRVRFDT